MRKKEKKGKKRDGLTIKKNKFSRLVMKVFSIEDESMIRALLYLFYFLKYV